MTLKGRAMTRSNVSYIFRVCAPSRGKIAFLSVHFRRLCSGNHNVIDVITLGRAKGA